MWNIWIITDVMRFEPGQFLLTTLHLRLYPFKKTYVHISSYDVKLASVFGWSKALSDTNCLSNGSYETQC